MLCAQPLGIIDLCGSNLRLGEKSHSCEWERPRDGSQLTETLALVGGSIHKNFGRDDSSKGQKCLYEFCIPKLLRQVIDEEVTAFRSCRNSSRLVQGRDSESSPTRL